jgi:hypothetical protein
MDDFRRVNTDGLRNEEPLTDEQKERAKAYAVLLGMLFIGCIKEGCHCVLLKAGYILTGGSKMSTILDVLDFKGRPVVLCSPHESEYEGAKAIVMFDKDGISVKISKFLIERSYQCFSNKPKAPWFRVDEDVDNRFLQRGNQVDFVFA